MGDSLFAWVSRIHYPFYWWSLALSMHCLALLHKLVRLAQESERDFTREAQHRMAYRAAIPVLREVGELDPIIQRCPALGCRGQEESVETLTMRRPKYNCGIDSCPNY